jgi:hypothetical protein
MLDWSPKLSTRPEGLGGATCIQNWVAFSLANVSEGSFKITLILQAMGLRVKEAQVGIIQAGFFAWGYSWLPFADPVCWQWLVQLTTQHRLMLREVVVLNWSLELGPIFY